MLRGKGKPKTEPTEQYQRLFLLTQSKFCYRLGACPELCLGLFVENEQDSDSPTLIGHVIAVRSPYTRITDGSMSMPENWRALDDEPVFVNNELIGNHKYGDTIAIHSVAVSPEYQGKKIGRALVRAYLEHLRRGCFGARKVVLIAHDYLMSFYESVGFKSQGKSQSTFAGGIWFDMVRFSRRLSWELSSIANRSMIDF
jgi:ribosomal protein S18 acetylase RimI-like enzyme